ncbi:MAG: AbrB/MazE/SpoVT family DNA-binding domain-containing protein [Chloroflexales bacterium]
MRTRIQKWGNSLAVRIPKSVAAEVGLADDSVVDLRVVNGQVVVVPCAPTAYTLDALLAEITDTNLQHELPTDPAVGAEVW